MKHNGELVQNQHIGRNTKFKCCILLGLGCYNCQRCFFCEWKNNFFLFVCCSWELVSHPLAVRYLMGDGNVAEPLDAKRAASEAAWFMRIGQMQLVLQHHFHFPTKQTPCSMWCDLKLKCLVLAAWNVALQCERACKEMKELYLLCRQVSICSARTQCFFFFVVLLLSVVFLMSSLLFFEEICFIFLGFFRKFCFFFLKMLRFW